MPKRKPITYLPPTTHSGQIRDYDSDTDLNITFNDSFWPGIIYVEIYDPAYRIGETDSPPPPEMNYRHQVRVNAHEVVSVLQRICPHLEITFKLPEPHDIDPPL